MQPIQGPQIPQQLATPTAGPTAPAENGESFKNFLISSIDQVNTIQHEADQAVEGLFTGGNTSPAEVLTAVQKADLAFRMMMQARNKLVQVYQEVQNIQI